MTTKPIISADLQQQIDKAVIQYGNGVKWRNWGMSSLREQGACILLYGPPGTGKTTIAEYLALIIRKKGIKEINFADFGSQVPGEGARAIRRLFKEANDNGGMTILLDEAEAVLWSRDKIGGTNTWMLEIIDELLVQIAKYKHLIIIATNRVDMLDKAIMRRLIASIHVGLPDTDTRETMWEAKWPKKFPLKLTHVMARDLAERTAGLTGATIERILINAASRAIMEDRLPTTQDFYAECSLETNASIKVD